MSSGAKFAAWFFIFVAAIAAMVMSYAGLFGLAQLTGFGPNVSPLLPIAIDVTIIAATVVWLGQGAPAGVLSYARSLALSAIGVSVLANATFHGLAGGQLWWLATIVAAVPPAFLAALVHLGALLVRGPGDAGGDLAPVTSDPVAAGEELGNPGEPAPVDDDPAASPSPEPANAGDDLVSRASQLVTAAGGQMGRARLAGELGVTEHQARQLLATLRAETPGHLALVAEAGGDR